MLESEPLITIHEAAKIARAKPKAIREWITKGADGVRLEAAKVGRLWLTSQAAIVWFGLRRAGKWMESPKVNASEVLEDMIAIRTMKPKRRRSCC